MKKAFLYALSFFFVFALGGVMTVSAAKPTTIPSPKKVDICHYDEYTQTYHLINVSKNAEPAHMNHGDGLPGTEVNDMRFDSDCTAWKYIETVEIDSAAMTGASSDASLKMGSEYLFEASGTWNNRGWEWVDAKYTDDGSWGSPTDDPDGGYDPKLLDLQVNSSFVDWGAYNVMHEYSMMYSPAVNGSVNFRVFDGDVDSNTLFPGWYGDNYGPLFVKIYQKV